VNCRQNNNRGFTLIEVLVSLAVFAILAALAYGVLNQTLASAEMLSERMNRLQAVQRTMRILSEDFSHGVKPGRRYDYLPGFGLQQFFINCKNCHGYHRSHSRYGKRAFAALPWLHGILREQWSYPGGQLEF
jgi:prepilin-type N-terminal cleavage/methylation domain-containing protein